MEPWHLAVRLLLPPLTKTARSPHSYCSYEMIFGLPPFYSENLNEMYRGIISAPLTFPTDFPVAQELQDIIRGFLTRDPLVTICLLLWPNLCFKSQPPLPSAASDRKTTLQKVPDQHVHSFPCVHFSSRPP